MLSIFPDLLPYGLFAPTIIRLSIAGILIYFGIQILSTKKGGFIARLQSSNYPFAELMPWPFGIVSFLSAGFLVIGFLTQAVAIVSAYLFLNFFIIDSGEEKVFNIPNIFYVVMFFVSLSLLFSGAGFLALDFPL